MKSLQSSLMETMTRVSQVVQIAAYELQVPMSMIKVWPIHNVSTPNNWSSGGSVTHEMCCKVRFSSKGTLNGCKHCAFLKHVSFTLG